ncbi:ArsR family transcriptional regulator [Aquibacillus halophilus]|uniref:ArsR family transcriptional regulator n=1 Tax=Aquibacillus halophilus TaxID=930132 RepID=UPI0030B84F14
MCVCDLAPLLNMTQPKLTYHLKILLDTNVISKDTRGTWSSTRSIIYYLKIYAGYLRSINF